MNTTSTTAAVSGLDSFSAPEDVNRLALGEKAHHRPEEVARQFEEVLLRQMLGESMKSMLQNGKCSESYGYFITEALAEGISKGGGVGIRTILESQLRSAESTCLDVPKP